MPQNIYKTKDGKRVPGVTTVIGSNLGWNKGALMYWAWNEGIEGRNYRDTSSRAADIGTIAHAMVEADLKGLEFDRTKYDKILVDKAETAYIAWLQWKELVNFELLASEKLLVSERYRFGGQIDIAVIKKVPAIVDIKTSNAVYADHKIQIAAYGHLWNEHHPDQTIRAFYLLQLGKEDGSFSYHYWPSMPKSWQAFKKLLELHNLQKELKKAA